MSRYIVREVDPSEPTFATREEAERFAEDLRPHAQVRVVEVHGKGLREARDKIVSVVLRKFDRGVCGCKDKWCDDLTHDAGLFAAVRALRAAKGGL